MTNGQVKVESLADGGQDKPNPITWQEKAANRKNGWSQVVDHSLSVKKVRKSESQLIRRTAH